MNYFLYAALLAELIAALTATLYFNKYKGSRLWLLLPLMWYILINEICSQFIFFDSFLLFNLYDVILGPSIILMTINQLKNRKRKIIVGVFLVVSLSSYLINLMFINPILEMFSIAPIISAILIVLGLLYYMIELLQNDEIIEVSKDLFLWVSFGFLIFFLAYPVLFFARKYMIQESVSLIRSLNYLHFSVGILSYLVIAFGFYYGKKRAPIYSKRK